MQDAGHEPARGGLIAGRERPVAGPRDPGGCRGCRFGMADKPLCISRVVPEA